MKVNAKFFCNHCGEHFDTDRTPLRCPVCDGYKISLQMDLWDDPDVPIPEIKWTLAEDSGLE